MIVEMHELTIWVDLLTREPCLSFIHDHFKEEDFGFLLVFGINQWAFIIIIFLGLSS